MLKAFVYRLYPNKRQERSLQEMLTTCRFWYNACLAERKTVYQEQQKSVSKLEQLRKVKELKASNPYASKVHSHVLQTVVQDLDKAFQAFFRRVKAGETPGFPRFKAAPRFRSFGFKEYGNGFKVDGRRLKMFGIGRVAVRWHRPIEGTIKTARIIRKPDGWYAALACEVEAIPLPSTGEAVGIDVGLLRLATTSDGEPLDNPRWYRQAQKKLRVLQRTVARRTKGGANRRKAVQQLARFHQSVANQRQDFLNKWVHKLIQRYDLIAIEELNIRGMSRSRLSKSILDAGWGYFCQRLSSKAENAGRWVEKVNPAYTSKTCSQCGKVHDLQLCDRWLSCECGLSLDRDENAAQNILRLGRSLWESSLPMGEFSQEATAL